MLVDCDLSDLEAFTRANIKALKSVPDRVLSTAEAFAAEARQTHRYQDRTENLSDSTKAVEAGLFDDQSVVDLKMGDEDAPYATYVVRRGFSNFPEIADRCGKFIGVVLNQVAEAGNK